MKYILIVIAFILIACSPSEEAIQAAIAQTEAARPTETEVPRTSTPTATATNTPTAIPSNTATPSPTPDVQIIVEDSSVYLLQPEDLPSDARYYLPNSNWITPHTNKEIVGYWGREEGLKYLEETGRIEGWIVTYKRGSSTVIAPEEIYCNIIRYETAQGARLTLTKYGVQRLPDTYERINLDLNLGDEYAVSVRRQMQSNGNQREWYRIEFAYRNYVVIISGWGWEDEVTPGYVYDVALTMLAKLEAAPLANP